MDKDDQNSPVSDTWYARISTRLNDIEREEGCRVLLAVESGSRAWGFHSPDSDYDVRFVYARPLDWHLNLGKKRDVIEHPVDALWDVSGWELSKALTLALGSNAVIAEWLQSPIVYKSDPEFVARMTQFCEHVLDRKSVTWHYVSLLRRQEARSLDDQGQLRLKRYFYMLRPVMALRWIRVNEAAMPPMDMDKLIAGVELDADTERDLEDLIALKKQQDEKAVTTIAPARSLEELIAQEWELAKSWLETAVSTKPQRDWDMANQIHAEYSRF